MKLAQEYAEKLNKKKQIRCVRVFEGMEDIVFRLNFNDWISSVSKHPLSNSVSKEIPEDIQIDYEEMHKRVTENLFEAVTPTINSNKI